MRHQLSKQMYHFASFKKSLLKSFAKCHLFFFSWMWCHYEYLFNAENYVHMYILAQKGLKWWRQPLLPSRTESQVNGGDVLLPQASWYSPQNHTLYLRLIYIQVIFFHKILSDLIIFAASICIQIREKLLCEDCEINMIVF